MKAAEHTFCFLTVVAESLSLSLSLSLQTRAACPGAPPAPSPSVWLMRSDLSDSRNPSADFIRSVFPANPSMRVFGALGDFSVAYGNVLPPIIVHLVPWYPPPPIPLWSASKWHSCLAAFITTLWWMSRPHLHNTAEIWVQMEGKLQELSMSSTWSFLTPTCRRPHIEVRSNILFLLVWGACGRFTCGESKCNPKPIRGSLKNVRRRVKEGAHLIQSSSRALGTATKARESSFPKPWSQDS